jgi:peptidoglycan/LPS O-acetylase OafA/YrhL
MEYRREIDGLRALAVLPVLFFHAGFDLFKGGFVGVDVFFVISGYLISSIVLEDLRLGNFSIYNFYQRRARRILPALFLVLLVSIPFVWFWFMPSDIKDFSKSLLGVSFFVSNILFWRESGYFDAAADFKPLLHTWSLSIEEQFYIFFPVLLIGLWRLSKLIIYLAIGILFLSSLVFSYWLSDIDSNMAFYILPTRMWELLAGALIGFYLFSNPERICARWISELGGLFGVTLILYAVLSFDKTIPFPGIHAVVPVLGAALVILFTTEKTIVGFFISRGFIVGVGLMSYSIYLWHQPIFALAKYNGFAFDDAYAIVLFALVFLTAYLSWRYVERPFRDVNYIGVRGVFYLSAFGLLFFSFVGVFGYKYSDSVSRHSNDQQKFLQYFENSIPSWNYFNKLQIPEKFRFECDFYDVNQYLIGRPTKIPVSNISTDCYEKVDNTLPTIFLWGDSHVQQLNYGLQKHFAGKFDILQVASSGCVPSSNLNNSPLDYCDYSNWFAYEVIKSIGPEFVIVGQNLGHDILKMKIIENDLLRLGVKYVIFTGPTPHWLPNLPAIVAESIPDVPRRSFSGINKAVLRLDDIVKKSAASEGIIYLSLIDFFCNGDGCLIRYSADVEKSITSWDYGHLTPIASAHVAKELIGPVIHELSQIRSDVLIGAQ